MSDFDPKDRQFALRMIPYGVFVATSYDEQTQELAAQTVHWVTQSSFNPPLVLISLATTSNLYRVVRSSGRICLHMLGKDDADEAFAFRAGQVVRNGDRLNGHPIKGGRGHVPLLLHAVASLECRMIAAVEYGDHHPILAEVIDTHVRLPPSERPDDMILRLDELGQTIFYGG